MERAGIELFVISIWFINGTEGLKDHKDAAFGLMGNETKSRKEVSEVSKCVVNSMATTQCFHAPNTF